MLVLLACSVSTAIASAMITVVRGRKGGRVGAESDAYLAEKNEEKNGDF